MRPLALRLGAVALLGGAVFLALTGVTGDGQALGWDGPAARLAQELRTGALTDVLRVGTELGSFPAMQLVVVAAAVRLALGRRPGEAAALVLGALLAVVAVDLAKETVGRPRPAGALIDTLGLSYPSGHAAYSAGWIAAAVALARAAPAARAALLAVAVLVALLVGASRVYLRAHYLTDVLGGWGLGAACFALAGLALVGIATLRKNGRDPAAPARPPS